MTESTRVMIVSAKVGSGHMRAAEALEESFRTDFDGVDVRNVEVLEYTSAPFRKSYTATYNMLASSLPSVWELIYETMEEKAVDSRVKKLTTLIDRVNFGPLRKAVREYDPHIVVATHYLPAEILGPLRRKGKLDATLAVVLTDYDIHTMWLQKGVDRYFVATDAMAYALTVKGTGEATVSATGIPVMEAFSRDYGEKDGMRKALGLRTGVATVLLAAGGFGFTNVRETAERLLSAAEDVQFLAVAGNNKALLKALEDASGLYPGKIIPFGFVSNMHELMAASDFAVTKSGGLTSSECLAMGLPMVIWNPVPGQEERNADYLLENGAALRANSEAHLVFKVKRLLDDGGLLARMGAAAKAIARPKAARSIASALLDMRAAGRQARAETPNGART